MRLWTLMEKYASDSMPDLAHLQKVPGVVGRMRIGKQSTADRSYVAARRWLLRGNVLSNHQTCLVTTFVTLNGTRSTTGVEGHNDDTLPKSAPEVYSACRLTASARGLVQRMSDKKQQRSHAASGQHPVGQTERSLKTALHPYCLDCPKASLSGSPKAMRSYTCTSRHPRLSSGTGISPSRLRYVDAGSSLSQHLLARPMVTVATLSRSQRAISWTGATCLASR